MATSNRTTAVFMRDAYEGATPDEDTHPYKNSSGVYYKGHYPFEVDGGETWRPRKALTPDQFRQVKAASRDYDREKAEELNELLALAAAMRG